MCGLPVNLPQLIFNNIIADNFEQRNLPYGMVLTIFFDYWGVDLSEEAFITPPRPFDHSFITCMMSHLPHSHQDTILDEEKTIPVSEPPHTTPPPIPPTDPYFTLLTSVHNLSLSHTQLRHDFYSAATHFAASQRLAEMHPVQIQNHLGYQMPLLLSICILFHPWSTIPTLWSMAQGYNRSPFLWWFTHEHIWELTYISVFISFRFSSSLFNLQVMIRDQKVLIPLKTWR